MTIQKNIFDDDLLGRVALIGAGSLGTLLAKHFLSLDIVQAENLLVIERDGGDCDQIRRELSCYGTTLINKSLSEVKTILLCVKPQDFPALAAQLSPFLTPDQIVVSCMAGVKIETIQTKLCSSNKGAVRSIIRAMPNLGLSVEEGVTVFAVEENDFKSEGERVFDRLFGKTGTLIQVKDESLIDAATALSGSGPAFFIYMLQSWIQSAEEFGFKTEDAERMVLGTVLGTLKLIGENSLSLDEWIAKVASRGGTTDAGLKKLESEKFPKLWKSVFEAAFKRSQQLD